MTTIYSTPLEVQLKEARREIERLTRELDALRSMAGQQRWEPLEGYIHFYLANRHLIVCDNAHIDGLPLPDDVRIMRRVYVRMGNLDGTVDYSTSEVSDDTDK